MPLSIAFDPNYFILVKESHVCVGIIAVIIVQASKRKNIKLPMKHYAEEDTIQLGVIDLIDDDDIERKIVQTEANNRLAHLEAHLEAQFELNQRKCKKDLGKKNLISPSNSGATKELQIL